MAKLDLRSQVEQCEKTAAKESANLGSKIFVSMICLLLKCSI